MDEKIRCGWAKKPIEIAYHDEEWGKPEHNDHKLFEFLILEGMQAGLSWITILNKRENMRRAFSDFEADRIAQYDENKIEELMQDAGIIRNRRKLEALVKNARGFLKVQEEFGTFDKYLWSFVDGTPVVNQWKTLEEVPVTSEISDRMSLDLKKRGFGFVGSTICYSYMQAMGLVNDHLISCHCHPFCVMIERKNK